VNTQLRQQWMGKIELLYQTESWKYAQFLCLEMLYNEPNFVDVRRVLHQIRQHTFYQQKFQRYLHLAIKFVQALWFAAKIKTKHRQLLVAMDELLNIDPNNAVILRLFAEIMSGFGFFETAIFAMGCIAEDKRNNDDWLLMGESFLGAEDFQMAVEIANKILAQSPDNIRARDLLWQSSVEQSMGAEKQ
jgi:tetratricopeptide (TPR) repeat protein